MSILHLMSARAVLLFVSLALITVSNGFQVQSNSPHSPSSRLFLAGFGASSGGGGKKNKKAKKGVAPIKLRPKQQWDRYSELKREEKVQVAIRLTADEGECTDWLEVGRVKSRENKFPELAVALQRAIIAEHGKRLYPLQVSKSMACEWGYFVDSTWKVVNIKETLANDTDGIEKEIGFEGTPDPATGFYCIYDGGKLRLGEETSFT